MLKPGDLVPHFEVTSWTGGTFAYRSIWQRLNLVIVTVGTPAPGGADDYVAGFNRRRQAFEEHDACCVITRDTIPGLPTPGVLVADKWGEIIHVTGGAGIPGLPTVDEVLAWTGHVQNRCPECEGEAR